jgi:outer membrane usher protein
LYSSLIQGPHGEWIRDLTNDTIDHPNHLTQLVLGDVFAQTNSALGGSDYLGGISYSSDFTLNPYFISSPSLNFSGAVTTPSTAQVYINGQLTNQISLSPGQFTLNDLPVVTGAGNVQVVIRNALGQVQQLSYPYYYSNQLLQKGLEQFSYNLGFIRQGVGVSSWGYTSPAFIGYDEKGLTRWLTAGLNFEDGVGVVNGGPTFVFGLPIGQVILNLAGSTSSGYSGFGTFLGYSYQNRSIGLGFSLEDLSSHFANLSLSPQEDRPLLQETGTLSFPIKFLGDFSLSYSFLKDRDQGDSHSVSLQDIYTFPDGLGLFISGERTTPLQGQPENQFFVGLNFSFGRDSSGNVSMQEKNGQWTRSLEVQKSLPIGTGFGYNVQASEGTGSQASQFNGELDYQGPDGLYELIESDFGGQKTTQLNVSGGVVGIGGGLYPMQSVQEGFALVRVPGLKGVKVYFENQFIGKTNAQGELLIPRLLPYYNNKISIDLNDIPMNYEVRKNSELVAVPNRGGVLVVFPVYRFQMILGKIYLLWNQTPYIPQYGELSVLVDGKWKRSPVGGKGSYYFENIPPGNHRAYLKYNHHLYHFMFVVPESKKMTLRLSPELLPAPSLPCPVGFCRKAPKSVLGRKI